MKCPDCDGPEHPKWKAHVFFKHVANAVANRVAEVVKPEARKRKPGVYRDKKGRGYYQRFLMQFRRAVASGKAVPWPR